MGYKIRIRYDDDDGREDEYDPDKARAMLAEIGLKDRDGDGKMEDEQGSLVEFTIVTNAGNNCGTGSIAKR